MNDPMAAAATDAEVFDHKKAAEERNLRLGQMLASRIALDIVKMFQQEHTGVHPAILTTALINCLATSIKLFSNGDLARGLEGADQAHAQLKQTVLSMMMGAPKNAQPIH